MLDDSQDELASLQLDEALFNPRAAADTTKLRSDATHKGFDNNCGSTWIYPTNYPVRQYQYDICRVALFRNTLVVLPTGLGKTFIAAVVMYNLYRWYPRGKVIFMAPTRPLVAQQIEACYQIMGIAKADTAELTGKQAKGSRESIWQSKRVFYCTPQVLAADLLDHTFPVHNIKLIVVDEAHKARGKYAYTEVIRAVRQRNAHFRVLALSATPGRAIEDVAQVVRNLLISHVEVRSESSPDVISYTHKKDIQTVVVPLDRALVTARNDLLNVIDPYVTELQTLQAVNGSLTSLSKSWLVVQQKQFLDAHRMQPRHPEHTRIMTNFSACISLYHGLELLEQHGLRIFLHFFEDTDKFYLLRDAALRRLVDQLRSQIGPDLVLPNSSSGAVAVMVAPPPSGWDFGHPKYAILLQHLCSHFGRDADSRALVFCEYRESVHLIDHLVAQRRPLLRPNVFVGQGGAKAVTQKQQLAIMGNFRSGAVNVLIATCVAEEGIDVGEIDLIVCFDISTKNPTRFVQRIGRTGRRRDGRVLMLCTEGKEQRTLRDVLAQRDKTNRCLATSQELAHAMLVSPRMVPSEFDPQCIETFIRIDGVEPLCAEKTARCAEATQSKKKVEPKGAKQTKASPQARGTQDVRNYFQPIKAASPVVVPPHVSTSPIYEHTIDYADSSMSTTTATDATTPMRAPAAAAVRSQATPNEAIVHQTLKKLRSLKLNLLRKKPPKPKELTTNDVIKSQVAPPCLKRFALENNIPLLESLMSTSSSSSSAFPPNGNVAIEALFGGQALLESFVQSAKASANKGRTPLKEIQLGNGTSGSTAKACAMDKEFFAMECKPSAAPVEMEAGAEAITQQTQVSQFIESESRYTSYCHSPRIPRATFAASTPLQHVPSARKRSKKPAARSVGKPDNPINNSFRRQLEKRQAADGLARQQLVAMAELFENNNPNETIEKSPVEKKATKPPQQSPDSPQSTHSFPDVSDTSGTSSKLGEILRFFRLNHVMDIFANGSPCLDQYIGLDDIFLSDDDDVAEPLLPQSSSDSDFVQTSPSRNKSGSSMKASARKIAHTDESFDSIRSTRIREHHKTARDISDLFNDSFTIVEEPRIPSPSRDNPDESDDSIPASQTASPTKHQPTRTIAAKLSILSHKLQADTAGAAQPIRQTSSDMFDVSVSKAASLKSSNSAVELSSSLKENNNLSPVKGGQNAMRKSAPFTDITKSPSLLAARMSFSRLVSMARSQRVAKSPSNGATRLNASSDDDNDDFDENSKKKPSPFSPCANQSNISAKPQLGSRMSFSKLAAMAQSRKLNNQNSPQLAATQEHSPIRCPKGRTRKRITISSSSDEELEAKTIRQPSKAIRRPAKRRRPCTFLDQECAVSGADSGDEDAEDASMLAELIDDAHDVHDTTGVDMHAIYMQSVRSPIFPRRVERAPPVAAVSFICSQAVEPDDDEYTDCSFVVTDDEVEANNTTALKVADALCPLERAELIMRQRREAKRLGIALLSGEDEASASDDDAAQLQPPPKKKKRRRVVLSIDSSEEEDA